MEEESIPSGRSDGVDYAGRGQWHDTIQLLRLVQSDYQGVRRQLEQVGSSIAERESLVSQRLQYALQISGNFQTLRLVAYATGSPVTQMGRAILGQVTCPKIEPKSVHLRVCCLGKFEAYSDLKRVERWQSVKAKSVFQYLLTRPRQPVVKEVLTEMLWPECDPRTAGNNLKSAIYGLRRTLDDILESNRDFSCLLFMQGSYLINPEIDLWVDVDEFQQHWALGRRFEKENKLSETMREYEKAEALYRGDYLEDEPYEEWTLLRREALIDTYLLILGKLAEFSLKNADYDGCITYSQKILAKDPCREDAYRRLMTCYSRLRQRNRALRWYEICRRTVQTELDTVPDRETSAMYHRLLRNDSL